MEFDKILRFCKKIYHKGDRKWVAMSEKIR